MAAASARGRRAIFRGAGTRAETDGAAALAGETLTIAVIGDVADTILRCNDRGVVLTVFRRSFYLRFGNDVVCVGPSGLGRGPLNALCALPDHLSWPDLGIASDARVLRSGALFAVDRLRFDFNAAGVWRAPIASAVAAAKLRTGLDRLRASARLRSPGGLGALLAAHPREHVAKDPLLRAASPAIVAVRRWLAAALGGSTRPPPAMDALIGLGPGLTPAGDDFLCGAMAALHYLGHADIATRLAARVLPASARETSLISAAYLRCAAAGQASSVLFEALESLLAGGDAHLERRLDAAHAVGHTSGWDSLAGAAAVCAEVVAISEPGAALGRG